MNLRLLCLGVVVTSACSKTPEPVPPPTPVVVSGEAAGMRYLEYVTGGARPDERVPMIIVLHPMGGDPEGMLELIRRYPKRARLVLPYGSPRGGKYVWFASVRDADMTAELVTHETERLAALISALMIERPTLGKPIVTGFSQGGFMSFALAATHPEVISAALPIGGTLPKAVYPSAALTSVQRPTTLPPVIAFHGADDLAVPTQGARDSIEELRRAGYAAELHEYAGVAHTISPQELADVFARIDQAAAN